MSRRRRPSPVPWILIAVLALALAAASAFLYRIYPEYQRLRSKEATSEAPQPPPTNTRRPSPKPVVAHLYFARIADGKQRLVAISRELPAGLAPAEAALEELIRGEVPRGCDRPLPRGTTLLGVSISNGIATADFSKEIESGFPGGSDTEGVIVYSVVNTLTSLPDIDKAQILVEGQRVNEIGGHYILGEPLVFDGEFVVPYP
jgi:spore germination protein GerM